MLKKYLGIFALIIAIGTFFFYQVNASRSSDGNYHIPYTIKEEIINTDSIVKTIIIEHEPETLYIYKDRQITKPAHVPEQVNFAGEIAPIERSDVYEALDKELNINTYWHSSTLMMLKRANRHFPMIDSILRANNIPADFKYLALIESGLKQVKSPAGAAGFWQFMKGTGKEFGLEVNRVVDERYHIEKATVAACKYLQDSYGEFKSWTLVAASYNAGKRRIRESLKDQKMNSYYDLYLNPETARYVYRILAIKEVFNHPEMYGFKIKDDDLYEPVSMKDIKVKRDIKDLPSFAIKHGSNYKLLKRYNPWLRKDFLKRKRGKSYIIQLPE